MWECYHFLQYKHVFFWLLDFEEFRGISRISRTMAYKESVVISKPIWSKRTMFGVPEYSNMIGNVRKPSLNTPDTLESSGVAWYPSTFPRKAARLMVLEILQNLQSKKNMLKSPTSDGQMSWFLIIFMMLKIPFEMMGSSLEMLGIKRFRPHHQALQIWLSISS